MKTFEEELYFLIFSVEHRNLYQSNRNLYLVFLAKTCHNG
jgi:hypothetical protein